jgi:hypothetical protein
MLLSRETHYTLNRVYLLFSCLVSFALPVLQLGFLKSGQPQAAIAVIQMPVNTLAAAANPVHAAAPPHFTWQDGIIYLYLAGALVLAMLLVVKLVRLLLLTRRQPIAGKNTYKLVEISNSVTAFSFFSTIFIGAETGNRETIIRHELVHVRQKHSVDIMLLEFFRMVNWFNPIVYLLQNSLKAVHEYIADEKTASIETDMLAYSTFLVNNAYGISGPSVAHSFFNKNLLRQRIIMLHQKRSGNLARLKYLSILPVCAGLLCISTLAFSKSYGWVILAPDHAKPAENNALPMQQSQADTNTVKHTDTNTVKHKGQNFVYKNGNTTSKGYGYKETGYLVRGKTDFRVIIIEKNGKQTVYLKSKCTPAEIKTLNEKYSYTFPSMDIFTKLPPPPPAPKTPHGPKGLPPVKFAPQVVVPVDTSAPARPARPFGPPPPARAEKLKKLRPSAVKPPDTSTAARTGTSQKVLINYYSDTAKAVGRAGEIRSSYNPVKISGKIVIPLILVNGVKYSLTASLRPGEKLYITGSDSTAWYSPGDARAKKKWGDDAAHGVYDLHGKPSITIR